MDSAALFKLLWPYAVVAAPGMWAVWKQWNGGKSLVAVAQDAAKQVIAELRAEVERLSRQVNDLEAELTQARKEHADTIASKDAELALLRGELRQAWATADAYERLLTEAGIPHEKPTQPIWRVPPGSAPVDVSPT